MVQELKENISTVDPKSWNPPVLKASAAKNEDVTQILAQFIAHAEYEDKHPVGRQTKMQRAKNEIMQSMISLTEEKFLALLENLDEKKIEQLIEGKTTAMFLANEMLP